MSNEKMREEFELWVQTRSVDTPAGFYPQLTHRCALDKNRYMISWVDSAWEGWQASRAAIEIGHFCGYKFEGCQYYDADAVDDALEDAGLKVKS